jgi:hypothetical protein
MADAAALSGPIMQRVVKFFEDDDWKFHQIGDECALATSIKGKNARFHITARVDEKLEIVRIYTGIETNTPENKRTAIAEYLTRANWGLQCGNFEMDFRDGEIRFKTSLDVEDSVDSLTFSVLKRLVYVGASVMDRYYPGIMSVIFAGANPKAAIDVVEERGMTEV